MTNETNNKVWVLSGVSESEGTILEVYEDFSTACRRAFDLWSYDDSVQEGNEVTFNKNNSSEYTGVLNEVDFVRSSIFDR